MVQRKKEKKSNVKKEGGLEGRGEGRFARKGLPFNWHIIIILETERLTLDFSLDHNLRG